MYKAWGNVGVFLSIAQVNLKKWLLYSSLTAGAYICIFSYCSISSDNFFSNKIAANFCKRLISFCHSEISHCIRVAAPNISHTPKLVWSNEQSVQWQVSFQNCSGIKEAFAFSGTGNVWVHHYYEKVHSFCVFFLFCSYLFISITYKVLVITCHLGGKCLIMTESRNCWSSLKFT